MNFWTFLDRNAAGALVAMFFVLVLLPIAIGAAMSDPRKTTPVCPPGKVAP